MASQAQILANRLNARKSTGPRTPDGKKIISQNALKHGLTAAADIISSESQSDFDLYRSRLLEQLAPLSPLESILAERIVSLSWRLRRTSRIQNEAIDVLNRNINSSPLSRLTQSLFPKASPLPDEAHSSRDSALALGRIAVRDFSNARVLERLLMYERRIEHSLYKTIFEFQRLNLISTLNTDSQPTFD